MSDIKNVIANLRLVEPPAGWVSKYVEIGPEDAKLLLALNTRNRKLREGLIAKYAAIMKAGRWRLSPQGIVVSDRGRLLDAQHRLHAVQRANVTVPFLLWLNVEDELFEVLDRGATRSAADALNKPKEMLSVANLAERLARGNRIGAPDFLASLWTDALEDEWRRLISVAHTKTKVIGTQGVYLAAMLRLLLKPDDQYVLDTWRQLSTGKQEMPPLAYAFYQAAITNKVSSKSGGDMSELLACIGWSVFDKKTGQNKTISRLPLEKNKEEIKQLLRDVRAMFPLEGKP